MPENANIKVAIIGGGLAGATLMNALMKHPHLDVEIFESAPLFSERGAAVGISQNGQAALDEIGGDLIGVLDRAGAVPMGSSRLHMGSGPDAMSFILDLATDQKTKVVHRAALLSELLKPIDRDKMHTHKKLTQIEELEPGRLIVHFEDQSTTEVDAVIGADGVHGHTGEHILGRSHAALKPQIAGFWDSRSLIPMQKAKDLLGEQFFNEEVHRQYGWIVDGGILIHDVLDNGKTVQCIFCSVMEPKWDASEWKRELGRDEMEKAASTWADTPIKNGIIEAMLENPKLAAYAQWHHEKDAPTYTKGHVCMMGDAAHSMTPWQGSGAGQAIEDAMILETLLKEISNTNQIEAAFRAYDQVRRPRTQRIVRSSHETGLIMSGRGPETGLDSKKIRESLSGRWHFILSQDQKAHKREALVAMT